MQEAIGLHFLLLLATVPVPALKIIKLMKMKAYTRLVNDLFLIDGHIKIQLIYTRLQPLLRRRALDKAKTWG